MRFTPGTTGVVHERLIEPPVAIEVVESEKSVIGSAISFTVIEIDCVPLMASLPLSSFGYAVTLNIFDVPVVLVNEKIALCVPTGIVMSEPQAIEPLLCETVTPTGQSNLRSTPLAFWVVHEMDAV